MQTYKFYCIFVSVEMKSKRCKIYLNMTKKQFICSLKGMTLIGAFCFSACTTSEKVEPLSFKHIRKSEQVKLASGENSPACDIKMDYIYIDQPADSITNLINQRINRTVLGEVYEKLAPEVAVDSFVNQYIRFYKGEVKKYYDEELKQGNSPKELPHWFNYDHDVKSEMTQDSPHLLNYRATVFSYQGGAHPNEWEHWLCFNPATGQQIQINEVIQKKAEEKVKELVKRELVKHMANIFTDKEINSVEDLKKLELPSFDNLFIPENFQLTNDSIKFLYNKYDIAPYVFGKFIVTLSRKEVEPFMIQESK